MICAKDATKFTADTRVIFTTSEGFSKIENREDVADELLVIIDEVDAITRTRLVYFDKPLTSPGPWKLLSLAKELEKYTLCCFSATAQKDVLHALRVGKAKSVVFYDLSAFMISEPPKLHRLLQY